MPAEQFEPKEPNDGLNRLNRREFLRRDMFSTSFSDLPFEVAKPEGATDPRAEGTESKVPSFEDILKKYLDRPKDNPIEGLPKTPGFSPEERIFKPIIFSELPFVRHETPHILGMSLPEESMEFYRSGTYEPLNYFGPLRDPEKIEIDNRTSEFIRELFRDLRPRNAELEDLSLPAVARLKANPDRLNSFGSQATQTLREFFADKGFTVPVTISTLTQMDLLARLFRNLVLREDGANGILEGILFTSALSPVVTENRRPEPRYTGSVGENTQIDKAITESTSKASRRRQFSGRGATRVFGSNISSENRERMRRFIKDVPVVVIGGGPAGLMATREMIELGFDSGNITVLDKTGEYRGIWNQKNVAGGSKNNPFQFDFEGLTLDAAPGLGSTVAEFLEEVEDPEGKRFAFRLPKPVKATVVRVEPGDLNHTVTYREADGEKTIVAPIVINATGVGKPLHPSREGHMTTDTPQEAGIRWQQILTSERAEKYRGKTLVFIGLGNSTAEMLVQLRELNRQGYNIDYRVITHYPQQAVVNPEQEIETGEGRFKVFRDIKAPNLVKWEGDLEDAKEVYMDALSRDKIVSDVTHWHLEGDQVSITTRSGEQQILNCAQLFTLIGYGQDSDALRAMGMTVTDEYLGTIAYDYDGEIQKQPGIKGRGRVYPGYFALGAVLKSPANPNAIVMPGIMHRMYDLLFAAVVRAGEYRERQDFALVLQQIRNFSFNLPDSRFPLRERLDNR